MTKRKEVYFDDQDMKDYEQEKREISSVRVERALFCERISSGVSHE
jgi:ABC-type Fe3+/spermidine/putrescine transport system ATPase subunit